MTYNSGPSLVLCERESSRGNTYFSGYWGSLSVALLRDGERPHPTRPEETITVWKLVAQERQPRPAAQRPAESPPERDAASAAPQAPSSAGARPGASQRPQRRFRREGVRARQERVSAEIARGYGLEADPDDAIPF
jgi:hypothetical protein